MPKKKLGSLFQGIVSKSPETAQRLKDMAKGKKAAPDGQGHSEAPKPEPNEGLVAKPKKGRIDRMVGVTVEKRSIQPRQKEPKNTSEKGLFGVSKKPGKGQRVKGQSAPGNGSGPARVAGFFEGVPGNATQFGLNEKAKRLDVVIGVDFGTSSTKVVIHAPHFRGNPAFAVPFGAFAHPSLKYLLPTHLAVKKDGGCSFLSKPGDSVITDIKVGLMNTSHAPIQPAAGPPCPASATVIGTAYLALVLRYARSWLIKNKGDIFGNLSIDWSWNIGLPAAVDDNDALRKVFNTAGNAAWLASVRPGPVTVETAEAAINDFRSSRFSTEEMPLDFQLIPEVVAEVIGYTRSQYRNEGLHVLVDVGASTFDLCSFILHDRDGEDRFPILTADVEMFGAKNLHQKRIEGAKKAVDGHATQLFDQTDPAGMIPNDLRDYTPTAIEFETETQNYENRFQEDCKIFLRKTIIDLRIRRDPNSPRWSETLPVFVCGGASSLGFYSSAIASLNEWLSYAALSGRSWRARRRSVVDPNRTSAHTDLACDSPHSKYACYGLPHG
jgi:hypothetical protein